MHVTAFPNPCRDQLALNFYFTPPFAPHSVYLIDLKGRVREKFEVPDPREVLSLKVDHLPRGIYILRALGDRGYSKGLKVVLLR